MEQGQHVDKHDVLTKAMTTTMMARILTTKERDGKLIPSGDAAQKYGTYDGGGGLLGNDNAKYDNVNRLLEGWHR